jgi:3-phenylpropionate/trans-cinnamate dioxygenase ferredoxin reductase subunit
MIVIVGAGQAAAQLVLSLRQGGYKEPIRMIGDEPYAPYQRPPLSKKFLSERPPADTLYFRPEKFWGEQGVTAEYGVPVESIDRASKRVTFKGGEGEYTTLFLSTGTRARPLPAPGTDLPGVFSLRRIDDVRALRGPLDAAKSIVIVGGGYIGLEVAAVARGEGRDVTVLEAEGSRDEARHLAGDLRVHAGFPPQSRRRYPPRRAACGDRRGGRVAPGRLADGAALPADLVLLAVGAKPNDDLAAAAGLACEDGVWSDEHGCTSDPRFMQRATARAFRAAAMAASCGLECVQNAIDQAKAVAAAILGKPQPYDPVPWFWSDQYELKLQMAGLSDGYDDAQTVGDVAAARFSVEYRKNGKLIAVDAVNDARAYMGGRKRIAEETGGAF